MNSTRVFAAAALVLMLAAPPPSGNAHHSMSEYDRSVVTEFEGEVVQLSWTNPHVLLWVETPDESGEPFVWDAYFIWRRGEEVNLYDCTLEY